MQPISFSMSAAQARRIWLHAQKLDIDAPFGAGPDATRQAVEHLGYVQIDTIHVIERSHHHILYSRIPDYRRADLERAQAVDKSVFEYWTHALSYVPTADYRFFVPAMERYRAKPHALFAKVESEAYEALLQRIRKEGALSIRDISDDVLVEKTHLWGSRKPSKTALQRGFFIGDLTISKRSGMVKSYELANRHFERRKSPRPVTDLQYAEYLLRRALRSQGVVSLDSICYGNLKNKPAVSALIDAAIKRKRLVPVHLEGFPKLQHWIEPSVLGELDTIVKAPSAPHVHILSPFDPLVIQRKRLKLFFDYEHRFEAYVPADKRVLGYFALPVLVDDRIVAAIDLKTDRKANQLLIQKWTWLSNKRSGLKAAVDEALHRFEQFQLTSVR